MTLINSRALKGWCPVCGAEHAACGPSSESVPVDQLFTEVPAMGGPLRLYRVVVNGHDAELQLNEADAEAMGATLVQGALTSTEANDSEAAEAGDAPAAKRRAPRNKARTPANKEGGGGG